MTRFQTFRCLVGAWTLACAVLSVPGCANADRFSATGLQAVYLTWNRDPTTTMTIHWLSRGAMGMDQVVYGPSGSSPSHTAIGTHHPLPHSDRIVHVVELVGLEPGSDYNFRIDGGSAEFAFRTMPIDASEPITFIAGGDVYRKRINTRIYDQAARLDPMFVVLGGDIVYGDGKPSRVSRWLRWLKTWSEHMVTSDGRLIPLLAAIGNHDVAGGYDRTPRKSPFFYSLFAMPGQHGNNVLDFGNYMSVVRLDSGHTRPIEGGQTRWLEQVLAERADVPHLFAIYHVPAFPSVRAYDRGNSPIIRNHWIPLFERYGVDVVFEHHDHAYKRTHPIRAGRVDPTGVLYLGDGAWGVPPRRVHSANRTWYLARSESVNHFIVTTIQGDQRTHRAVNARGQVFDTYPATTLEE